MWIWHREQILVQAPQAKARRLRPEYAKKLIMLTQQDNGYQTQQNLNPVKKCQLENDYLLDSASDT